MKSKFIKIFSIVQTFIVLMVVSFSTIIHLPKENDNPSGPDSENNQENFTPDITHPDDNFLPDTDLKPSTPPQTDNVKPVLPILPESEHKSVNYIQISSSSLNIRSGSGTQYKIVGRLKKGEIAPYLEITENGWIKIIYKNKFAYISADKKFGQTFIIQMSDNTAIESVIREGMNLLGFPYVYGAVRYHDGNGNKLKNFNSTKFDCSSLMQYIFYIGAGIPIHLTTRTQIKQGVHVPKSKIQRGDLLFFTNAARRHKHGIERVGHVALYLGNNTIFHTASTYALIEEISTQRHKDFIEARRIIL